MIVPAAVEPAIRAAVEEELLRATVEEPARLAALLEGILVVVMRKSLQAVLVQGMMSRLELRNKEVKETTRVVGLGISLIRLRGRRRRSLGVLICKNRCRAVDVMNCHVAG